jgi:uncharacterized protein YbjT (DUF2867 family)
MENAMSNKHTVLVTGASGKQGYSVAEALLKRGHKVRALTRNAGNAAVRSLADKGAEIITGNFENRDSVARAAKGADAAFLMGNFYEAGAEGEIRQGVTAAAAIAAAGVGHLIYSSVASANRSTGIPHFDSKFEIERHIAGLGVPYTIAAPVAFMENAAAPWSVDGLRNGVHAFLAPAGTPMQLIATGDIGAFVARLVERRSGVFGRRYDIAADELTGTAQAEALSRFIGRPIAYHAVSPAMVRQQSEDQALMAEWFERVGYTADIPGLRKEFADVQWQSYEDWARQVDWSRLLAIPAAVA